LIAYRSMHDHFIDRVLEAPFETRAGSGFRLVVFRNRIDGIEHAALVKGNIRPDRATLVRVHRVDFGADVLGGFGPRAGLVEKAIAEIDREGAGVVVLLRDLAPDGLSRRMRGEFGEGDADETALRVIGVGSQILRTLGVERMVLLANTPHKLVGI